MVTRLIGLGEIGFDSMNESIFQCPIDEIILLLKDYFLKRKCNYLWPLKNKI